MDPDGKEPDVTPDPNEPEGGTGVVQKEYSESEKQAMQYGWKPKDEWAGDPEEWVPARQFIKNGELFGRIHRDSQKISKLEKALEAVVKHNERVYEAGYEAAMNELKAQRREAIRENDPDALEAIEDRMEQLEKRKDEGKQLRREMEADPGSNMHPAWLPWLQQNTWYNTSPEMHGAADGIAKQLVQEANAVGRTIDYPLLLNEITRKIRERYPEKFATQRGPSVNMADDSGNGAPKRRDGLSKRLTEIESNMDDGEREIMQTILASTEITKEKYLQDIDKVNRKRRG